MITLICAYCGAAFERSAAHAKKSPRHFCSQKCYGLSIRKKQPIQCDHCGKTFYRTPNRATRHQYNFCSRACSQEFHTKENHWDWHGGEQTVQCSTCNAPIIRPRFDIDHRSEHFFCNAQCCGKWQSQHKTGENHPNFKGIHVVICSYCGKEIKRPRWWADREQEFNFCDSKCMGNWYSENLTGPNRYNWKGGKVPYYGPNWTRQRRKARKRDNYTCQHCGIDETSYGKSLDVHHLKPFREFGYIPGKNEHYREANKLSNLVSLCQACHKHLEP